MSYSGAGNYSHHSGREYRVLELANDMDTGKTCVVYTRVSEEGGLLWFTRSLESFNAQTFRRCGESDLDGEVLPKFTKSSGELTMEDLRK